MIFQAKIDATTKKQNSLVVVGLDPNFQLLPKEFQRQKEPLFEFCKWIVDETHAYSGVYKVQLAYFEARGSQGVQELEKTTHYIRKNFPEHLIIADAKRGDIADTNEAYVQYIFDYLDCDAVTLHPYLGREALQPFLDRADKGVIILCHTSNQGAGELQDLSVRFQVSGDSEEGRLWEYVAMQISREWNVNGNCLLVVGATYPGELERVREIVGDMWLLVPGIGAQGGDLGKVLQAGLTTNKDGLLIAASRSIIFASDPNRAAQKLRDEINCYSRVKQSSKVNQQ